MTSSDARTGARQIFIKCASSEYTKQVKKIVFQIFYEENIDRQKREAEKKRVKKARLDH